MASHEGDADDPVVVLAPTGRDADLACDVLSESGILCRACSTLEEFIPFLDDAGAACATAPAPSARGWRSSLVPEVGPSCVAYSVHGRSIMQRAAMQGDATKTRILIVEDHPLVRKALRDIVDAQPDLEVCGEAGGAPEAIDLVRRVKPELAIVDLSLAQGSGLELIKCIRAQDPDVRILVSSMHDESLFARRALQAGALGFINKGESEARYVAAIRDVLRGRVALSGPVAQRILKTSVGARTDSKSSLEKLSDREVEVLELLGRGLTTRRVAERLNLSVKTVETYREKLKRKLLLDDGAELVRFASVWVHEQSQAKRTGEREAP